MKLNEDTRNKILELLKEARELDNEFEQFGSSTHEYKLKPTIDEDSILEIEEKYNFKLPEDYRWFIKEVGNGGAGPGYGIYQFSTVVDDDEFRYINDEPIIRHDLSEEDYENFISSHYKKMEESKDPEEKRHLYLQLQQGLLLIATTGLSADIFLIISGPDRGRVIFSDPKKRPKISSASNFVEWYINWLQITIDQFK